MRPVRVTVVATGSSSPVVLEVYGRPQYAVNVDVISGSVTYTLQFTNDNLFDTTVTPVWFDSPDPDMVGQTASKASFGATGPFALKLVNAGTGTVAMTVLSSSSNS